MSEARARLFVALALPDDLRAALVGWQRSALGSVDGLRLVAPDALHATLCFLGSRPVEEIDPIRDASRACSGAPIRGLTLGGPVWLPARRPRVVAVGVNDAEGALASVQASLSAALSDGGWYAPEARPFLAHVTVARVPRGVRVRPVELPAPPSLTVDGGQVTLYRSRLGSGGARYEALS